MRHKKAILTGLAILCVVLFGVSAAVLIKETVERKKDQMYFNNLQQLMDLTASRNESESAVSDGQSTIESTEAAEHVRNLDILIGENPDCVGWIYIEDTRVNYPVMHTPTNPEKYLRLNFYGEYSVSGVPFVDGNFALSDMHMIMYGHNMKNDTMFADIENYIKPEYRDEHPLIEFETAEGCCHYEVFAVAMIQATDEWYYNNSMNQEEDYNAKIAYLRNLDLYDTGIVPQYGEKLITLSTCYGSDDDNRLIVVAVKRD